MKKKDEVAFLRSITGTTPIKKKNTLKKISISVNKLKKTEINTTKIFIENLTKPKPNTKEKNLSVIKKIEKTSVNRKLKRGKILPDKKIDFHGMFLLDAEELFNETVVNCYNNNQRCILFITGKGIYKKDNDFSNTTRLYYGKIRNSFVSWTKKHNIEKYILSVEQANLEFGADGAFFVYLRENRG